MDDLRQQKVNLDATIDPNAGPGGILAANHNQLETDLYGKVGKYTGSPFTAIGGNGNVIDTGKVWFAESFSNDDEDGFVMKASQKTNDLLDFGLILNSLENGDLIHFKDFVGRSALLTFRSFTAETDTATNPYYRIIVQGGDNPNYIYQADEAEICVISVIKNQHVKNLFENVKLNLSWGKFDGRDATPDFTLYYKDFDFSDSLEGGGDLTVKVRHLIVSTENFGLISAYNPTVIIERYSPHAYKGKETTTGIKTYQRAGYKRDVYDYASFGDTPRMSEFPLVSQKFIQDINAELYFKYNKFPSVKGLGNRNIVNENLSPTQFIKGYVYLRLKLQITINGTKYTSDPKVSFRIVAQKKLGTNLHNLISYGLTS